jgi:hypothetical protein
MEYVIKVTIIGLHPPIWRRLRVRGSLTFAQLHRVLQEAFGWLDYHLYRFVFDGLEVVEEDPYSPASEPGEERLQQVDPAETAIGPLFEGHHRCVYEYDFGDSWKHEIVVERKLPRSHGAPECLAGARHRPPEDVGGVDGYERFLASIRDKADPERDGNLAWAAKDTGGRLFDPEYFYLDETNARLRHVLEDTPEAAASLFLRRGGLTGELKVGWCEPVVIVGGEPYSWERLGTLLLMLDEDDLVVTTKVQKQVPRRSHGPGRA